MFIAGAYHSLRRRVLNMSVLIATGVLAAYLFSVLITVLGGRDLLRGGGHAGHVRAVRPLDGDALAARHQRRAARAVRPRAAAGDRAPRWRRSARSPSSEVRGRRHRACCGRATRCRSTARCVDGETSDRRSAGHRRERARRPSGRATPVIAGSINRSGSVRFRATKVGADTTLAQIVELVAAGAELEGAGAAPGRPGGAVSGDPGVGVGLVTFVAVVLSSAGAAADHGADLRDLGGGDRLPGRARPGDADGGGGRHRHRRAAQHPDQGCRDAGARVAHHGGRPRQDRHADRGPAGADRRGCRRAASTRPTPAAAGRRRPSAARSTRWPRRSSTGRASAGIDAAGRDGASRRSPGTASGRRSTAGRCWSATAS